MPKEAPKTAAADKPADESSAKPAVAGAEVTSPEVIQGPAPGTEAAPDKPAEPPSEPAAPPAQPVSGPLATRAALFGNLADLISAIGPYAGLMKELLANVDVGKLRALLPAIESLFAVPAEFGSTDWIKQTAAAGLKVLRVWAGIQPGVADTTLLDKLDHLINVGGPALDALAEVVHLLTAKAPTAAMISQQDLGDVLQGGHTEALKAASIDPTTFLSIVQAIFQLIQMLKGIRGGLAPKPAAG